MANQSFIVGDAGGTGTQWRVVNGSDIKQFETIGYNAYTHNLDDLKVSIQQTFGEEIDKNTPVFFYAAGIDTAQQQKSTIAFLSDIFGKNVSVENDLVGVARSLCGKESGNVCILGTGSNACFYDGESVNKVSASLGYVLGDEGSGAYMGKKLMMGVFREQFSLEINELFHKQFKLTSHDVIKRIYHQPKPNHFLASFSTFIYTHRNQPDLYRMIQRSFNDFFDAFFSHKKHFDKPFHFSGSIAYYFSDMLREVGTERGIHIKNIVQSPIAGLALYHQTYD
jgi:N-acetylglucosamine kinase-like BadF-type ATPase